MCASTELTIKTIPKVYALENLPIGFLKTYKFLINQRLKSIF